MAATVKTKQEIEKIRTAGKILAKVLKEIVSQAKEGVTLNDLDELAYDLIQKADVKPAFLGYQPGGAHKPFPATLCTSVNEVVVHGVPTKRRLRAGDLLKLDLGVNFEGYNADAAVTVGIGKIFPVAEQLIHITFKALEAAIAVAIAGNTLGDIGYAIKKTAEAHNFKVFKELTGHAIGKKLHEEPTVLNYGTPGKGLELQAGMVLAIEPMLSAGSDRIRQLADESYATVDKSLNAHFEHTILVKEGGAEILTML